MYREGVLPSGEPMQATVVGSTRVDGRMFSCVGCHLRSGQGAVEGSVIARRIAGGRLFEPLYQASRANIPAGPELPSWASGRALRPAYTDTTLARAIRLGLDPQGRPLSDAMPRYALEDRDLALLIEYLRQLSATVSPGVDDTTLRFATVFSEDAPASDREAMLATLEAFVRDHNAQNRGQEARAHRGSYMMRSMYASFRRLELLRWKLTGPPVSWRDQLQEHYARQPVFALLGGITGGAWEPVHAFCEANRIPALMPVVDYIPASEGDWYTVYFGRGADQEAETAARYLRRRLGSEAQAVQVFRMGAGRFAEAFTRVWTRSGGSVAQRPLAQGEAADTALWAELSRDSGGTALVLWLGPEDLASVGARAAATAAGAPILASATLLAPDLAAVPEALRGRVYLTYPYALPQDRGRGLTVLEGWHRVRGIPLTSPLVQSKMLLLASMLPGVFAEMSSYFYRDYLLDVLDMSSDQRGGASPYPRLSFGPAQRYLSKGCYIVQLGPGPKPEMIKKSDWVVH